jgi:Tfp pilus assembly PilM family ATPase
VGDERRTTLFVDIGYHASKALIAHGGQLVFAKLIQVGGAHFDAQFAEELGIEMSEARERRRRQAAQEPSAPGRSLPSRQRSSVSEQSGPMAMAEAAMDAESDSASAAQPLRPGEPSHEMIPAGGEMLDCLIDELQLCLGYHASMFPGRQVDQVVFLGGEANQRAMCRRIAQSLRLPAQLGDPLCRIGRAPTAKPPVGIELRLPQPGWAVPLGLCRMPANL